MGPLIFLGLGQKQNGEIDAIFSAPIPGVFNNEGYGNYGTQG